MDDVRVRYALPSRCGSNDAAGILVPMRILASSAWANAMRAEPRQAVEQILRLLAPAMRMPTGTEPLSA